MVNRHKKYKHTEDKRVNTANWKQISLEKDSGNKYKRKIRGKQIEKLNYILFFRFEELVYCWEDSLVITLIM